MSQFPMCRETSEARERPGYRAEDAKIAGDCFRQPQRPRKGLNCAGVISAWAKCSSRSIELFLAWCD